MNGFKALLTLIAIYCSGIGIDTCAAQTLPQEIKDQIGDKIGISPNDPNFDQKLASINTPITDEMMRKGIGLSFGVDPDQVNVKEFFKQPVNEMRQSSIPLKVVQRFEFDSGELLENPGKEELKKIQLPNIDYAASVARAGNFAKTNTEKYLTAPVIPECSAGKFLQDEAPPNAQDEDYLVISKKAPLDADQLYGKHTKVIEYRAGSNADPDSVMISFAEPECLPYRVRIYKGRRYLYYGEPALRNFDLKPLGAGKDAIKPKVLRGER